jgi:hypothetical protein
MTRLLSAISRRATIIILVALIFSACKVKFVPDYDNNLALDIDRTSKMIDNFYLSALAKTKPSERQYTKFVDDYVAIEVELNSIYTRNKIRPLNKNSTRIAEIALQIWKKYQKEHKEDDSISDGIIKLNQMYMDDLFYAMRVAEEGKRMAEAPPGN